ncbi:MAG: hypothetical protein KKH20_11930, partial [Proteobacteria bacterium]|nr:hypothetical protein [Pseudomonadota bacterium]
YLLFLEIYRLSKTYVYSNIENMVLWARSEKNGYAQKLNSKLNSKHEARNPKQIQNPNIQMTKTNTALIYEQ